MWISGYCSPRYESENRVGVYSEKCQMQLSSVLALYTGAINHLFVISIHSIIMIILMNALNRNMISLPKFHSFIECLVQRHLSWFNVHPQTARIVRDHLHARQIPGMEWPACSPDLNPIEQLYYGISWGILLEQWDAIPQIMIIRLTVPQHEEKVPSYHRGIWGINTVLISMWALR